MNNKITLFKNQPQKKNISVIKLKIIKKDWWVNESISLRILRMI